MLKPGSRFVTIAWCAFVHACASGPMSPTPASFVGDWSGTTFQGSPITFTVSSDQKVTAIAVGYSINGCSGFKTFSNLNVSIEGPTRQLADYGSGPPGGPNSTYFHFFFTSSTAANGTVAFVDYPDCGNAGGTWSATKR